MDKDKVLKQLLNSKATLIVLDAFYPCPILIPLVLYDKYIMNYLYTYHANN